MSNQSKINEFFLQIDHFIDDDVPQIISETAREIFKESFSTKSWDGKPWPQTKKKVAIGSLMLRHRALFDSIQEKEASPTRVIISAGSSSVPYARVHNEGGEIVKKPRVEKFRRNRVTSGTGKGRFSKGKTSGDGFVFKESRFTMPQRQFMGVTPYIGQVILNRIEKHFKSK